MHDTGDLEHRKQTNSSGVELSIQSEGTTTNIDVVDPSIADSSKLESWVEENQMAITDLTSELETVYESLRGATIGFSISIFLGAITSLVPHFLPLVLPPLLALGIFLLAGLILISVLEVWRDDEEDRKFIKIQARNDVLAVTIFLVLSLLALLIDVLLSG